MGQQRTSTPSVQLGQLEQLEQATGRTGALEQGSTGPTGYFLLHNITRTHLTRQQLGILLQGSTGGTNRSTMATSYQCRVRCAYLKR